MINLWERSTGTIHATAVDYNHRALIRCQLTGANRNPVFGSHSDA